MTPWEQKLAQIKAPEFPDDMYTFLRHEKGVVVKCAMCSCNVSDPTERFEQALSDVKIHQDLNHSAVTRKVV